MNFKISKKLFTENLLSLVFGLVSIYFFSYFYENIFVFYFILFSLGLITLICFKKIFITRNLLFTLIIFIFSIFYFYFNSNRDDIFSVTYQLSIPLYKNFYDTYYAFTLSVIAMLVGYFYGLQFRNPLNIISKIFLFQITAYIIYNYIFYFDNRNDLSLEIGYLVIILLPYIFISLKSFHNYHTNFFLFFLLFFLIIFSMRGSLIAFLMFIFNYKIYFYLNKNPTLYRLSFWFHLILILLLCFIIISFVNNAYLNEISESLFNKKFNSGRSYIWTTLIHIINENIWLGYGGDQSSNFILSIVKRGIRTTSSHNSFIEILFRGGFIGLFLFISLFYSIWVQFLKAKNKYWSRLGSSYLVAILYIMTTQKVLISQNFTMNLLFWLFIGVSLSQSLKETNLKKKSHKFKIIDLS